MKKEKVEFNDNPPLRKTTNKYVVLKDKVNGNVFWTSGGEFRIDLYDMIFQSDNLDEVKDFYMKLRYQ